MTSHWTTKNQYIGCYFDALDDRAMDFRYKDITGRNSNGRCIRDCSSIGSVFAGTSARNECFCSKSYHHGTHDTKPDECLANCQNNDAETCGGDWRLQIYSVCPIGKYRGAGEAVVDGKPNCESECHCDLLPCFYFNGTCTDGCAIGWKGDACNERGSVQDKLVAHKCIFINMVKNKSKL
ncbi:hypothetical protein CAPTEDRAFT_202294 [Capitella teleta]|uniref:WSC domain-containing protein n=1 Tax=Capitella teleta TaxID=283909 RepID=R7V8T4_CAPTE|nr:hypothetical protein CAPTEDRAFT_202294 [Capitella teleta]|eukprot:ELU15243.1 hypothetical protein CAPTEDRAFT_202294 [Capitella teleta]